MQFVIRPRMGGKTTEALKWLKETPGAVLLVHSEAYAACLRRDHGLTDRQVMSHRSAGTRLRGRRQVTVAVDNLDVILPQLLGLSPDARVELVTATGESA
jgi:hypothetical protein